jgi:hypothetical protein
MAGNRCVLRCGQDTNSKKVTDGREVGQALRATPDEEARELHPLKLPARIPVCRLDRVDRIVVGEGIGCEPAEGCRAAADRGGVEIVQRLQAVRRSNRIRSSVTNNELQSRIEDAAD